MELNVAKFFKNEQYADMHIELNRKLIPAHTLVCAQYLGPDVKSHQTWTTPIGTMASLEFVIGHMYGIKVVADPSIWADAFSLAQVWNKPLVDEMLENVPEDIYAEPLAYLAHQGKTNDTYINRFIDDIVQNGFESTVKPLIVLCSQDAMMVIFRRMYDMWRPTIACACICAYAKYRSESIMVKLRTFMASPESKSHCTDLAIISQLPYIRGSIMCSFIPRETHVYMPTLQRVLDWAQSA